MKTSAVMVMVLATVWRTVLPIRVAMMIVPATGMGMRHPLVAMAMIVGIGALHLDFRAAFPTGSQAADDPDLGQQAKNDDAGGAHACRAEA